MEPTLATIKRLFAVSRNQCAFPDCDTPIVEPSGTVTGVVCHIKARSPGGPRYDASQSDEARHSFLNLILACARHSKVIDAEPTLYTVQKLQAMKALHEGNGCGDLSAADARKAELLLRQYRTVYINAGGNVMLDSPGSIQASTVVVRDRKRTLKILPPQGSIASDTSCRNYIKHLIDRYHLFAGRQPGRKFAYAEIYETIKRRFGAKWDLLPLTRFNDLVVFLQKRIDRTALGSINRAKASPNYSTFEEYCLKYRMRRKT